MWINAIAWLVAGYSTAPGLIHLAYFTDLKYGRQFYIQPWLIGGLLYAIGAITYALKCPEKHYKRTFDIYGSSH